MPTENNGVRLLLLVEDNDGDAALVEEIMAAPGSEDYRLLHAGSIGDATLLLKNNEIDVILLDLGLPDCAGVESVRRLHEASPGIPIVVLTGGKDGELATACLDAGAQDYLEKGEVGARSLRRSIGYAISRSREAQLRETRAMLERYRAMSSAAQTTSVTAQLAGLGPLKDRNVASFERIARDYHGLIEPYLLSDAEHIDPARANMEAIATCLGDLDAGPRDLLDVHLAALDRAVAGQEDAHSRSVVVEARLLALQMMGHLVEYYRVGHRRRFLEGPPT